MTSRYHEAHRTTPLEIFCSYAHEDDTYRWELERHLSLLSWQNKAALWQDRRITAGTNWSEAIDTHLETASIILLLISSDFLASQYCYGIEMQRALQRHEAGLARVIPIIVRSCDWLSAPFASIQVLPTDGKPITTWPDRDTAWTEAVKGIRRAIDEVSFSGVVATTQTIGPVIWNVPFARNPFFTGREDLLEQLHAQLRKMQTAAVSQPQAVSGLGGIGKTQLAIEYAYWYASEYQAVLWAKADTTETLNASYTEIAELLNLPQKDAQEQGVIVQAVKGWLANQRGWLLILDNADEPDLLLPFLPSKVAGRVLVTTRASTDLAGLGLGLGHALAVETFTEDVGALFLLHRSGLLAPDATLDQTEEETQRRAKEITHDLGGLPLALDQAGTYLKNTGCGIAVYQQIYQQHRAQLLNVRHSAEHPESVATTWNISFEQIEQRSAAAADLLRFCAYLAPAGIPEELFSQGASYLGPQLEVAAADPFFLGQAIEIARSYSLLQRDISNKTLTMHRLVQAVIRDTLPVKDAEQWMLRALLAMDAAFPEVEFDLWPICEQYVPHVLICVHWMEERMVGRLQAARLLDLTGRYLGERGRYTEAELLVQKALAIYELVREPEHLDIAASLNDLGSLSLSQGRYRDAELFLKRALVISEHLLGAEHPGLSLNLNNLALLSIYQGNYKDAELLLQKALGINEKSPGQEHPNTASSLKNLALLYIHQGRYGEAEPLLERARVINERVLGLEHPETAACWHNLAGLYEKQGHYEEAKRFYERAFAIRVKHLGYEHPDTATCLNELAGLLKREGHYKQAEQYYRWALMIREKCLGAEHFDVAASLIGLVLLFLDRDNYRRVELGEIEALATRALAIYKTHFGAEHPGVATCLISLGEVSESEEHFEKAASLYQQALKIREKYLGVEHPDTATSLNNLASLYVRRGSYREAEPLLQRALSILEHTLGPEHPNTHQGRKNYAALREAMKQQRPTAWLSQVTRWLGVKRR